MKTLNELHHSDATHIESLGNLDGSPNTQGVVTLLQSQLAQLRSIKDMEVKWLDRYSLFTIPVIAALLINDPKERQLPGDLLIIILVLYWVVTVWIREVILKERHSYYRVLRSVVRAEHYLGLVGTFIPNVMADAGFPKGLGPIIGHDGTQAFSSFLHKQIYFLIIYASIAAASMYQSANWLLAITLLLLDLVWLIGVFYRDRRVMYSEVLAEKHLTGSSPSWYGEIETGADEKPHKSAEQQSPREQTEEDIKKRTPTILLLVRHTDVDNPNNILYGRLPRFGLSTIGRQQAECTASVLAKERVSAIYSSPRLRALQTARIVASRHPDIKVHITRSLDEVLTGWQGLQHNDSQNMHFGIYDKPANPDDEKIPDLWLRVSTFVQRALRKYKGGLVVCVTHGDLVAVARAAYLGKPLVVDSLSSPGGYPGKGCILRLTFNDPLNLNHTTVEYYDPNGMDPLFSKRWVSLERVDDILEPVIKMPFQSGKDY